MNGYRVFTTSEGVECEYDAPDQLEQSVRLLVLRKNEQLRGWDLRFLRRGLKLSQTDLGLLIDRDAQTVARWEKSADPVPKFADLAIRARFAERFAPEMTISELLSYIDGRGKSLPEKIILSYIAGDWRVQFNQNVIFEAEVLQTWMITTGISAKDDKRKVLGKYCKLYEVGSSYFDSDLKMPVGEGHALRLTDIQVTSEKYEKLTGSVVRYQTEYIPALLN